MKYNGIWWYKYLILLKQKFTVWWQVPKFFKYIFKLAVRLRTREASKNQVVFVCLCFVWLLPFSLINGEIVFLLLSWASLRYVYIWWSFWWYFLWRILWRFFGLLFWLIFDFFWWIFLTFFFSFLALSVSLFN